jgi:hypothetical protein
VTFLEFAVLVLVVAVAGPLLAEAYDRLARRHGWPR